MLPSPSPSPIASAIRRSGDAAGRSPAPPQPALLTPGAGEPLLTDGQKIALLKMRRSDWSKAVLTKLKELDLCTATGDDFRSLVPMRLAISKGSYHVLTSSGRWRADRVAEQIAREASMHIISYDFGGRYGRGAFYRCTCGASAAYRSKYIGNYMGLVAKDARHHLEHVGAIKKDVA